MATTKKRTGKTLGPTKLPLSTITREPVVLVEVGLEHEKHYVHKALLVHHSEYFRKALQGPWEEAQSGKVLLEDVEPAIFNIFEHWLYFGSLPPLDYRHSVLEEWGLITHEPVNYSYDCQRLLCMKAYAFGDRIIATTFRNSITGIVAAGVRGSRLIHCGDILPVLVYAFANIPSHHAILHFLVDDFCNGWSQDTDDEDEKAAQEEYPKAFMLRVMRRYSEMHHRAGSKVEEAGRCYLEHTTEEEKKECSLAHIKYDEDWPNGYFG